MPIQVKAHKRKGKTVRAHVRKGDKAVRVRTQMHAKVSTGFTNSAFSPTPNHLARGMYLAPDGKAWYLSNDKKEWQNPLSWNDIFKRTGMEKDYKKINGEWYRIKPAK